MNVATTLDERYFEWLYGQVGSTRERNPSKSHYLLCELLYKLPFEHFVPNDHNRAEDGRHLRDEFFDCHDLEPDHSWFDLDCSFLEMLVGLSKRLEYQSEPSAASWFWKLLTNLELAKYTDSRFNDGIGDSVIRLIERFNARMYEPNGRGGLFPLHNPDQDQRNVEIWYQMSAYLMEHEEYF